MPDFPLNLLLADDDPDDCIFFKDVLDELPIATQLLTVNDGVQLMQLLSKKESPMPDVLYLDLNMPRKNGFECLLEIKAHPELRELPVIIFSTSLDTEVIALIRQHGAKYYIRKPAEFADLKNVIHQSLSLISTDENAADKNKFLITP